MLISNLVNLMVHSKVTIRGLSKRTSLATLTITRARDSRIAECRLSTLEAISRALGCKVKDLFDEVDKAEG